MSSQFQPIRSSEAKLDEIGIQDGQFIVTDKGNIHISMPDSVEKNQRLIIRGAMIPIVLTETEYYNLIDSGPDGLEIDGSRLFYDPNGIYMIIRDSAKKETE